MALSLLSKRNKEINKVVLLPLRQIDKNPNQPRKSFDAEHLQELSRSIAINGLLQPITVRRTDNGRYELIAGERRTLAFRSLGREAIPAIIEEFTDEQSAVLSIIENLQRKDLNYFEEANGIARLMEELGLTQQEISSRLGKAQSTIANKLRLLRFSSSLQRQMLEEGLTERHARAILKLTQEEQQIKAVEYIAKNQLTVSQTEQYIERVMTDEKKVPAKLFVVKDMRIFLNTINKAVGIMNSAGIPVDTVKNESDDYLEYTIRVPKESVHKQERPVATSQAGAS